MNLYATLLMLVLGGLLLALPRQWAILPLLAGIWVTASQNLEILGLHFTLVRVLLGVGMIRLLVRAERPVNPINGLDRLMICWTLWNVFSCLFHSPEVLAFRFGTAYDNAGAYYLCRALLVGDAGVYKALQSTCLVLIPIAATMLGEKLTGKNVLGPLGFGLDSVITTNNHYRASGPFGHPILAGTVGAVCLPMAVYMRSQKSLLGWAGLAATVGMVAASGSSGPILAMLAALGGVALWKVRGHMRTLRWLVVVMLVALDMVMNDPVYFLMARIDITGGSTGYFRAQLIRSAIAHLDEWWLIGTDYTRHWMLTGITANPNHTDITNHYLCMAIWGGLTLMILFIALLAAGFARVGKSTRDGVKSRLGETSLPWALGCVLFGHAAAMISISYFDQTFLLLSLVLACIGSLSELQSVTTPIPQVQRKRRRERISAQ